MAKETSTFNSVKPISFEEAKELYFNSSLAELKKAATDVCNKTYGNRVFLRGLIEFSNICHNDCLYCGIRRSNKKLKRYRLNSEEILSTVKSGINIGLKTFVLQSGESNALSVRKLAKITEKIKSFNENVAITLSCGYFKKSDLKTLKNAGSDRYLIRFETADERLYSQLKNGEKLSKRIEMLHNLKELDYETGSGFMVGLPEETDEIMLNNLKLCKELELDMVGIGPFIPHPETPLKNARPQSIERTVRAVALLRLLLPFANIPATTAAGTLHQLGREKMLEAGANVLMPNITPVIYKKHYLLYPVKFCLDENGLECISCLKLRVKSAKKEVSLERGDSLSFIKKKTGF